MHTCAYIYSGICMNVCYLWLLAATALCCANLTDCFHSCRLPGCLRFSVQKSVDNNWKNFQIWLGGGVFWFSVGRICLFFGNSIKLNQYKTAENLLSNNRGNVKFLSHLCTGKAKANSLAGSS